MSTMVGSCEGEPPILSKMSIIHCVFHEAEQRVEVKDTYFRDNS